MGTIEMKRTLSIFLILIFILSGTSAANAKTTEAIGSTCPKEKLISQSNDGKFMCTKLDGKLTWQINTIQNQLNIWNNIQKIRARKPKASTALDVRFSPTVNKTLANSILNSVDQAARLWQEQYLPKEPLPTLFFTEKDRSWFIAQIKSIGVYNSEKVAQFDDEVKRNSNRANWAGISGQNGKLWMTFMIGTGKQTADTNDFEVAAHEYTHLAQQEITKFSNGSGEQLACWQIEGGAFFYGVYLGAKNPQQLRELILARNSDAYYLNFSGLNKQPLNSFESLLDKYGIKYDHQVCGPDGAYPVGSAGMEYLYYLKGHQGTIDLLANIAGQGSFTKGIEVTFGKDWPKIRKEMANYIKLVVIQSKY